MTDEKPIIQRSVWFEKNEKELIRYRLFRKLSDDKFFVKSVDDFYDEFKAKVAKEQNAYFVDSLFYNGITAFAKESFDTIEEAINHFDAKFD